MKYSIPHIRLINHRLVEPEFKSPEEVVAWLGAMQSQDYTMAKWAVGRRLPGCTDRQVEEALNGGDIIRTHILRPTWHFVSKNDIRWMLQLTAPRVKKQLESYNKMVKISAANVVKSLAVLEKILANGNYLTKQEIGEHLEVAKVKLAPNQVSLVLSYAEVEGLVCSGVVKGRKQTYRLLSELASGSEKFDRDKALAELARRFFVSHAPATLEDFTWWSGLTITEAKKALEMNKHWLVREEVGGHTYWLAGDFKGFDVDESTVHLLPNFDEYIVSYKDRGDVFTHGYYDKVINTFGIFKPTVMVNGQMVGRWKRVAKSKKTTAEVELFVKISKQVRQQVKQEVEIYERFANS